MEDLNLNSEITGVQETDIQLMLGAFFGTLQYSIIKIWREHLTTSDYVRHIAAEEYYKGMIDKIDALVESYQAEHEILYMRYYSDDLVSPDLYITDYLQEIKKMLEKNKIFFNNEGQSIIDGMLELVGSVLYKMRKLTGTSDSPVPCECPTDVCPDKDDCPCEPLGKYLVSEY